MYDRALPLPALPIAAPLASGPPSGARAFWVQWLRAQAQRRKAVTLSPAACSELALLLEQPTTYVR